MWKKVRVYYILLLLIMYKINVDIRKISWQNLMIVITELRNKISSHDELNK